MRVFKTIRFVLSAASITARPELPQCLHLTALLVTCRVLLLCVRCDALAYGLSRRDGSHEVMLKVHVLWLGNNVHHALAISIAASACEYPRRISLSSASCIVITCFFMAWITCASVRLRTIADCSVTHVDISRSRCAASKPALSRIPIA